MGQDCQYKNTSYNSNEIEHLYGENIHILSNPYLSRMLAVLSSPQAVMPMVNSYLEQLYIALLHEVVNTTVSVVPDKIETRLGGFLEGDFLSFNQRFISVDLARAGTYPSHVCFHQLNLLFNSKLIRQDHIYLNRKVDNSGKVVGVDYSGSKIGGEQEGAIVLFPDPMGATGGSMSHVVDQYKKSVGGSAKQYIAMHLIITPEYLAYMKKHHPDVMVFAIRLDRGLSTDTVLQSIPGTYWEKERGLNETQYIVPGAGGIGELLNNTDN